jgi:hypothetical protein
VALNIMQNSLLCVCGVHMRSIALRLLWELSVCRVSIDSQETSISPWSPFIWQWDVIPSVMLLLSEIISNLVGFSMPFSAGALSQSILKRVTRGALARMFLEIYKMNTVWKLEGCTECLVVTED